jgi:glycosyltransferase involved in cell wall biosynthesis
MKILAMEPYGERKGHFGLYASKICQHLSLLGHKVTLVTSQLDPENYLGVKHSFQLIKVGFQNPYFVSTPKPSRVLPKNLYHFRAVVENNVKVLSCVIRLLKEDCFDVVHFLDFEPLSTWFLLKSSELVSRVEIPTLVITLHPADFRFTMYLGKDILRGLYKAMSRVILRRLIFSYCRAVTVHSAWHKRQIEEQLKLGIPHSVPVVVVPYAAELPTEQIPQRIARRRIGLSYNGPLFLFFGMIRKDKGIEVLLEAIKKVTDEFKLLIVGSPFDYTIEELQSMIRGSGLEDRVITRFEYISENEIGDYFFAADAVVLPYRKSYVGGAGPLITACSYGKPVIASKVAEMAMILEDNEVGIGVVPEDASSLAEAIRRFISLPQNIKHKMSQNGLKLAGARSWANMAKRFSEIYAAAYEGRCD